MIKGGEKTWRGGEATMTKEEEKTWRERGKATMTERREKTWRGSEATMIKGGETW